MIDSVKAFGYVSIKDKLGFEPNTGKYGFYGIVAASTWSETITIWLKFGNAIRILMPFLLKPVMRGHTW